MFLANAVSEDYHSNYSTTYKSVIGSNYSGQVSSFPDAVQPAVGIEEVNWYLQGSFVSIFYFFGRGGLGGWVTKANLEHGVYARTTDSIVPLMVQVDTCGAAQGSECGEKDVPSDYDANT